MQKHAAGAMRGKTRFHFVFFIWLDYKLTIHSWKETHPPRIKKQKGGRPIQNCYAISPQKKIDLTRSR